jgi:hypothetical protein
VNLLLATAEHSTGTHAMLRGFTDSTGVEWRVWEVFPSKALTPTTAESFSSAKLKDTVYAGGWLCFESKTEKRRLAPIPTGWDQDELVTLEQLLAQATPVELRRHGRRTRA